MTLLEIYLSRLIDCLGKKPFDYGLVANEPQTPFNSKFSRISCKQLELSLFVFFFLGYRLKWMWFAKLSSCSVENITVADLIHITKYLNFIKNLFSINPDYILKRLFSMIWSVAKNTLQAKCWRWWQMKLTVSATPPKQLV